MMRRIIRTDFDVEPVMREPKCFYKPFDEGYLQCKTCIYPWQKIKGGERIPCDDPFCYLKPGDEFYHYCIDCFSCLVDPEDPQESERC